MNKKVVPTNWELEKKKYDLMMALKPSTRALEARGASKPKEVKS